MPATREDFIGNKLIPLPTRLSFGKSYYFVLHLGLNVAKSIYEINFCRGLRTDFCIDMYLNQRWPWSIVFLYALNISSQGHANMGLVKSLLTQCLVRFQDQQQLVLVFIWKLMFAVFRPFVYIPTTTRIRCFAIVWRAERVVHYSYNNKILYYGKIDGKDNKKDR